MKNLGVLEGQDLKISWSSAPNPLGPYGNPRSTTFCLTVCSATSSLNPSRLLTHRLLASLVFIFYSRPHYKYVPGRKFCPSTTLVPMRILAALERVLTPGVHLGEGNKLHAK